MAHDFKREVAESFSERKSLIPVLETTQVIVRRKGLIFIKDRMEDRRQFRKP